MSELVANCPRCRAQRITFDLISQQQLPKDDWQRRYEAFCICRRCCRSTIFILAQREYDHGRFLDANLPASLIPSANEYFEIRGHVAQKDMAAAAPPDYLPEDLEAAF